MKTEVVGLALVGAILTNPFRAAAVELKYPASPFVPKAVETYRPEAVVDGRQIVCGDKILHFLNDRARKVEVGMRLTIADKTAFEVRYQARPSSPGWDPFVNFPEETLGDGKIVRARPFKITKEGPGGVFRQTGEVRDGKAVVTSQFVLEDGAALKGQTVCYDMPMAYVAGTKIVLTDARGKTKALDIPTAEGWTAANPKGDWKGIGGVANPVRIALRPDDPARAFVLAFEPGTHENCSFYLTRTGVAMHLGTTKERLGRPFAFTLDFGLSAKPDAKDCVVNGINFTRNNDSEFARYPEARNLLVNPSFESGARYYHQAQSGTDLRQYLVEGEAHSGRFAFRLGGFKTFSMPTRPNRSYVLSLYAKSADGRPHDVKVTAWSYELYNTGRITAPLAKVSGDGWQRLSFPFKWAFNALALDISGKGVVIDDLQLEEGTEPTAYVGNRMGVDIVTDAPDNLYANLGETFNARFVVRGPAGTRGTLASEIVDFFGRSLWKGDLGFSLDGTGVGQTAALPEAAFAARGSYVVRMTVKPEGLPAYRDFFRLARFPYADATAKNRYLHMIPNVTWPNAPSELKVDERNFRRTIVTGTACALHLIDRWGHKFTKEETEKIVARYGKARAEIYDECIRKSDCEEMEKLGLGNPHKLLAFSPEAVRFVEERACRNALEHPEIEIWDVGNETSGNWAAAGAQKYDEFVKFSLAIQRGVHRACPGKPVTVYGTCNNSEIGRREIRDFLTAWKKAAPDVRPSAINVHPYRPNPDAPDLDRDFKALMDDLDRLGFADVPVYADEGAFFLPLVMNDWNGARPGMSTQSGDGLTILHMPSYDLGWGERLSAAYWVRYIFMGYKYAPRLRSLSCWGSRCFTLDDPFAQFVANAAMVDLVGNATFRRDVRFAPGARAYVFDDGKGGAVAVYWRHSAQLDQGSAEPNEIAIDLTGLDAKVLDLMGNEVKADPAKLPLGVFPMYVKTAVDKLESLAKAFERAKTDVVLSESERVVVPQVQAPHVAGAVDWSKVPAVKVPYVEKADGSRKARRMSAQWLGEGDLSATYRFAWDEENLYLRVEARDDLFVTDTSSKWGPSGWYESDSVQLFFDTFGDAKQKFADGYADHDENDMSYELLPTNATTAVVYRRTAPDFQLTGGVHGGLIGDRLEPGVTCDFAWDETTKTRTYTVKFPRYYVQPIPLVKGTTFGFGIYVIDRDYATEPIKNYLSNVDPAKGTASRHPAFYTDITLE